MFKQAGKIVPKHVNLIKNFQVLRNFSVLFQRIPRNTLRFPFSNKNNILTFQQITIETNLVQNKNSYLQMEINLNCHYTEKLTGTKIR